MTDAWDETIYLPTNSPSKSSIHVGKSTIQGCYLYGKYIPFSKKSLALVWLRCFFWKRTLSLFGGNPGTNPPSLLSVKQLTKGESEGWSYRGPVLGDGDELRQKHGDFGNKKRLCPWSTSGTCTARWFFQGLLVLGDGWGGVVGMQTTRPQTNQQLTITGRGWMWWNFHCMWQK